MRATLCTLSMIELHSVSKFYGSWPAVRDVSCTVHPGEVTGLLGPNGAGKTTLIRMMTGFLTQSAGLIRLFGHDTVTDAATCRAAVGYLPESAPSYLEMRVESYLRYRAKILGVPRSQVASATGRAIERCWLTEMRDRRIGELSKGYRQRVGLASAIVHNPLAIVLDEPSSGLDPSQIVAMRTLISELAAEKVNGQPRVVLLSSHILSEVQASCPRVMIIARGQLRAVGSPAELIASHHTRSANASDFRTNYRIELSPSVGGDGLEGAAESHEHFTHRLLAAVRAVPSVEIVTMSNHLERSPRTIVLTVTPRTSNFDDARVRRELSGAVNAAAINVPATSSSGPWLITELHRNEPTLEQVFMNLVESPVKSGPALAASGVAS